MSKINIAPVAEPATWFPSRKVLAGGIAGILSWVVLVMLQKYTGFDPQPILDAIFGVIGTPAPAVQPALAGIIAWGTAYVTPSSIKDLIARLNDDIVRAAAADPNSAVSARTMVLPPATKVVAASSPAATVAVPPATANWNDRNQPKD